MLFFIIFFLHLKTTRCYVPPTLYPQSWYPLFSLDSFFFFFFFLFFLVGALEFHLFVSLGVGRGGRAGSWCEREKGTRWCNCICLFFTYFFIHILLSISLFLAFLKMLKCVPFYFFFPGKYIIPITLIATKSYLSIIWTYPHLSSSSSSSFVEEALGGQWRKRKTTWNFYHSSKPTSLFSFIKFPTLG